MKLFHSDYTEEQNWALTLYIKSLRLMTAAVVLIVITMLVMIFALAGAA